MTEEQIALARRAVACRGWRWMRGMVAVRVEEPPFFSEGADPSRIVGKEYLVTDVTPVMVRCIGDSFRVGSTAYVPDLTDSATLGCLLALVREAWGDHATSFANGYEEPQDVWVVHNGQFSSDDYGHEIAKGSTEVEALVVALEAAQ